MTSRYKSQITDPSQLIIDKVYYRVTKLNDGGWITEFLITSKPYIENTGSLFVKTLDEPNDVKRIHAGSFSLDDYNVIPNTYNQHRVFSNLNDAEQYLKD